MKEQLAALYELQGLDMRIAQIKSALTAMAASKAARQQLSVAKSRSDVAENALNELEMELRDSEIKLKSIDDKRTKCEKRLYDGSIKSPKELAAVEKEIALYKSQQFDLDGRVLDLYDKVEAAREQAKSTQEVTHKAEKQLSEISAKESAEHALLKTELAELETRRASAAAQVTDKHLMSRYEAIRNKNGSTAIAKVVEGRCEGCRVSVTTFIVRSLYADTAVQYCENCGRILCLDAQ